MVMKSKRMVKLISLIVVLGMLLTSLPVAAATADDFTSQIPTKESAGSSFRLGVISDSHLDPEVAETKLTAKNMNMALQTMQALGVDALAMNGDMVYAPQGDVPANLYSALKGFIETNGEFTLAGSMNEDGITFQADTTENKKPIIYSMGNHEFPLNGTSATAVSASKQLFTEQTGRAPAHVMKINGYTFIVAEPADYLLDFKGTEEFVMAQIEEAEKDNTNKPIFYLQHEAIHGTVIESPSSASDNTEEFKNFLKNHPRVIAFSGHSHAIIEDPRSIWQDGFTVIATSQIGGGSVSGGSANYSMGLANTGSQCIMIDMTEKTNATDISVYRLNLLTGKVIGTPFEFTIDGTSDNTEPINETFKYTEARYNAGVSVANFNETAKITPIRESRQSYTFNYTTDVDVVAGEDVDYLQDNYVHAYRVALKNKDKNVIEQNFKVFGDVYEEESSWASSYNVALPNALNLGTNYELSVYALTPFTSNLSVSALDVKGVKPVKYSFTTAAELTDAEKASIAENGGINVALNKTVYTAASSNDSKGNLVNGKKSDKVTPGTYVSGSQVTLPSGATTNGAANQGEDWFMIDLGRRYNLAQIKVWPSSAASDGYMMDFAVKVSNTEDFSSSVTLGSFAEDKNKNTPIIISGDSNAYRYVRLEKTKNTYYTIGELEVYAAVKTAEDLIGPKVMNSTRVDDNTISVSFAHKMDEASIKAADAIKVLQKDGTPITPSAVTLTGADEWDGGYDATLTFENALPANGLTLKVAGSVSSADGATFVDELSVPIAGKALTINKSYSKVRQDVNVALNKAVIAGNTGSETTGTYAVSKLTDGSTTTGLVVPADSYKDDKVTLPSGAQIDPSTSSADDWYMIDLGRRYVVSNVVVHPYANKPAANFWGFEIQGSNDETFANYTTLGEVKVNDENIDGATAVSIDGDGTAYRYIRLKKTVNTYHIYSEIEIFADITITDVARKKPTEWGAAYSTLTGKNAVDGNISTLWRLAALTTDITNLIVDLEAEYPVEMAELYRSTSNYQDKGYTNFKAYGYSANAGKPATLGAPANPTATLFNTTGLTTDSKYFDFAQGNYRYLVLSKPNKEALALAEFKAFVVNPIAYSAVANGDNTITISFTDKMEITTLVESNFSIDGITLSNPDVTNGWDGGYDVTFDYNGIIVDGDEITVKSKVRNENGIEMTADKVLQIKSDTYTIKQNSAITDTPQGNIACNISANFKPETDATVVLYAAVKNSNGALVDCVASEPTPVTAGVNAQITDVTITPKSGETLCLFLWENEKIIPICESMTVQTK